jgi:hypothetical protein
LTGYDGNYKEDEVLLAIFALAAIYLTFSK